MLMEGEMKDLLEPNPGARAPRNVPEASSRRRAEPDLPSVEDEERGYRRCSSCVGAGMSVLRSGDAGAEIRTCESCDGYGIHIVDAGRFRRVRA